VEETLPFKMAKDPEKAKRLDEVLYNLCECCRILAVLLSPFLIVTSPKIYEQLGLKEKADNLNSAKWGGLVEGHVIGEPSVLFPKKDAK
jgi:methionyl-tRNA synthetase